MGRKDYHRLSFCSLCDPQGQKSGRGFRFPSTVFPYSKRKMQTFLSYHEIFHFSNPPYCRNNHLERWKRQDKDPFAKGIFPTEATHCFQWIQNTKHLKSKHFMPVFLSIKNPSEPLKGDPGELTTKCSERIGDRRIGNGVYKNSQHPCPGLSSGERPEQGGQDGRVKEAFFFLRKCARNLSPKCKTFVEEFGKIDKQCSFMSWI